MKAMQFRYETVIPIDCPDPNITIVLQIPAAAFEGYGGNSGFLTFSPQKNEKDVRLRELIAAMFSVYEKREYGYEFKVKSQFMEVLYLLVTQFQTESSDKGELKQKKHLDRLSKVTAYMKENYSRELSQKEVADHFGFTPAYQKKAWLRSQ